MEGQMPLVGPLWVSNKHGRSIEHCFIFIFFQYKGRWNWNIFTLLFNFWRAIFYLKKKKRNFFGVWFVAVVLIWFLRCNDLWDVIYEIIKWGWSAIWSIADRFSIKIGSHWFFSSSPLGGTCNCVSAFQVTWECDPPIVFEQKVNHKVRVGVGAEIFIFWRKEKENEWQSRPGEQQLGNWKLWNPKQKSWGGFFLTCLELFFSIDRQLDFLSEAVYLLEWIANTLLGLAAITSIQVGHKLN